MWILVARIRLLKLKSFFEKKDVKAVLLKHYHEDHSGGAYIFEDVYAPRKSLKILKCPPGLPKYRQLVWGQPKPVLAKPLKRKIKVDDVKIRVVETPGNSSDLLFN